MPEPGLPMLTRLPFRSSSLAMFASLRASTVNGSGWIENTARRSANLPSFSNTLLPFIRRQIAPPAA